MLDENSGLTQSYYRLKYLEGNLYMCSSFIAIHPAVVETFHSKLQMLTSSGARRKVRKIHHLESMNACTKFVPAGPLDVEWFHRISENFDLNFEKSRHY